MNYIDTRIEYNEIIFTEFAINVIRTYIHR